MLLAALGGVQLPVCTPVSGLPPASYHRMPPGLPRFLLRSIRGLSTRPTRPHLISRDGGGEARPR
jgi:hypothetical protein